MGAGIASAKYIVVAAVLPLELVGVALTTQTTERSLTRRQGIVSSAADLDVHAFPQTLVSHSLPAEDSQGSTEGLVAVQTDAGGSIFMEPSQFVDGAGNRNTGRLEE